MRSQWLKQNLRGDIIRSSVKLEVKPMATERWTLLHLTEARFAAHYNAIAS